jgi:hypothetical protein
MTTLTYSCAPNAPHLTPLLKRAAAVWNGVLSDLIQLQEHPAATPPNISVKMDSPTHPIRNSKKPTRVAVCKRVGKDSWQITLSSEVKWATSSWNRFFGRGENALTCLIHELGHVFRLPHATDPSYAMHPEIGGNGKLTPKEKQRYREHFLKLLENER